MRLSLLLLVAIVYLLLCAVECLKVLVIGGTGRVGSRVVSQLVTAGIETRMLVRDIHAAACNPMLAGAIMHAGDLSDIQYILAASAGCDAIIATHGPRPIRYARLSDLYRHPRHDPSHPYNLYYIATKRILAAMDMHNIPKLVQLSGSLVGQSAFNPFVVLFNMLLAGSVRWHEHSERDIRASKVNYTILRVPEILDEPSLASIQGSNTPLASPKQHLAIYSYNNPPSDHKPRSSISVCDVADLCVQSVLDAKLTKSTVYCGKQLGPGPSTCTEAIACNEFGEDTVALLPQRHRLAGLVYSTLFVTVFGGILRRLMHTVGARLANVVSLVMPRMPSKLF